MTDEIPVISACGRSTAYYRNNTEHCRGLALLRYHKNREKINVKRRELRDKNREKIREQARNLYWLKREKILARCRELYRIKPPRGNSTEAQKAANREKTKRYRARHKEKLIEREQHRVATDPSYKFVRLLRSRVGKAVKAQYASKAFKTMDVIGCSMQTLFVHLEKQFLPGMGWDNYGREGWHIDHIIPCAAFDLSKPAQQKKCFHFSNLRPAWARHNHAKASKIEGELPLIYRIRSLRERGLTLSLRL